MGPTGDIFARDINFDIDDGAESATKIMDHSAQQFDLNASTQKDLADAETSAHNVVLLWDMLKVSPLHIIDNNLPIARN